MVGRKDKRKSFFFLVITILFVRCNGLKIKRDVDQDTRNDAHLSEVDIEPLDDQLAVESTNDHVQTVLSVLPPQHILQQHQEQSEDNTENVEPREELVEEDSDEEIEVVGIVDEDDDKIDDIQIDPATGRRMYKDYKLIRATPLAKEHLETLKFISNGNVNRTSVINNPLVQTHSLASSEHCFHFVLFC